MQTSGAGRSNEHSGFTLVELAVVLLILTLALGLVLPGTASILFGNDLRAGSRRLAGAVAYARNQAMLQGSSWELTLDLDANTFWTAPEAGAASSEGESSRKRTLPGKVRFVDVQKSPDVTMTAGMAVIRFRPNGLAEPALIHLALPTGETRTLVVKAFNCRTAIYDRYIKRQWEKGATWTKQ